MYSSKKAISKSNIAVKILLNQNQSSFVEFEVLPNYIITIDEQKSYTFLQLINDIGGVIGFVLGASLLSIGNFANNVFFKYKQSITLQETYPR